MTYRAAVMTAPRRIEIREFSQRRLKKYECEIRVEYAGVCGTDLALYSGGYPTPLPLVLGHEFCGRVERVGDKAFERLLGKRVTGEINNTCLAKGLRRPCAHCAAGREHHCLKRDVVGIVGYPGAFAERIAIPARNAHALPETWPTRAGALIEPLAAALQTFEKTPLRKGDSVVVLGVGRLGAFVARYAKDRGARVLAVCRTEERRRHVRSVGVSARVCPTFEDVEAAARRFAPRGADIVVEATGHKDALGLALRLVRPEGCVALKSTPGEPAGGIDLTKAVVDEVRIQGSRCGPFGKAIAYARRVGLADGMERFVTGEYGLERIEEALAEAARGGKVVVACGG